MPRPKRSLPCRSRTPPPGPAKAKPWAVAPLAEGPAIRQGARPAPEPEPNPAAPARGTEGPLPYRRGSVALALRAAERPEMCREALVNDMSALTSRGALDSRKSLWSAVASRAGYQDPFALTPDLIYTVMGALKLAHYRSAELYLDAAKAEHVMRGHAWTDQLVLARRGSIRSCRRHLGNPRQAKGLPLPGLGRSSSANPWPLAAPSIRLSQPFSRHGGSFVRSRPQRPFGATSPWITRALAFHGPYHARRLTNRHSGPCVTHPVRV